MTTTDLIEKQKEETIQSDVRTERDIGVGLLFNLARAGELLAPWWSKTRDAQLRKFAKESDHFLGAMYMIGAKLCSIPFRVEPRDPSVRKHRQEAELYQIILEEGSQFGQGWGEFWTRSYADLWTQDNGFFGEIIGDGPPDGPIKGPKLGLAQLDSWRCTRSSDPEFPVKYTATDGTIYKLHHTRVIFASQLPSPAAGMYGVGHCWLSRAVNMTQRLVDMSVYYQEKLGSRPLRALLIGQRVSTDMILNAIAMAEEGMDNQWLRRYSKMVVIGDETEDIDILIRDLISLPDGFDEDAATRLAMATLAVSGGFPMRWIWPLNVTTKADAMYQHIAGSGGGASWHVNLMRRLLAGSERGSFHSPHKFLPPYLRLVFDYQDDEQDRMQADARKTRAATRQADIEAGVVDVRTAREHAVRDGDLTINQFEELELEDGRLPDGNSVLTLFNNPAFKWKLLDLGVQNPLDPDVNDPLDMLVEIDQAAQEAQRQAIVAPTSGKKKEARQALAALAALKPMYEQRATDELSTEIIEAAGFETALTAEEVVEEEVAA